MNERVLVTGATGFIGSHVAAMFAAAGWSVRATVRASSDLKWVEGLDVETVEADLATPADLTHAVSDVQVVVHSAGLTRARSPEELQWVNVEATSRLAEASAAAGVRRFVYLSSLAARGPDPVRGPRGLLPGPTPASDYGRSKRAGEEALQPFVGAMSAVVLRLAGVYGPRDNDLLPMFRMADRGWLAVPAGDGRVQPVHVSDAARATLKAVEAEPVATPLPLAEEHSYTWPEVAEALGEAVGRRLRVMRAPAGLYTAAGALSEGVARLADRLPALDRRKARDLAVHSYTCDIEPTVRALGWKPEIEMPEGLRQTATWYREVGWLQAK